MLLALDRDEEFAFTKPRHAFSVRVSTGADDDGRLRHVAATIVVNNGAYNHVGPAVMRVGALCLGSLYRPDAVEGTTTLVDTALLPGGAFRGFGIAQVGFAVESQIDVLAALLDIDPIDLRLRNANVDGQTTLSGFRVGTARLADCLAAVRTELDWDAKRRTRTPYRGLGVACSMHPSGSYAFPGAERSEAAIDIDVQGRVRVRFGGADPGTGQRTLLAQIAAHEIGAPLEGIEVIMMDSEQTPFDMGSFASRGTHMSGQAARQAGRDLADRLSILAGEKLGTDDVRLAEGRAWAGDDSVSLGDLVAMSDDTAEGVLTALATHVVPDVELLTTEGAGANIAATYAFAAHGAEVEVDPVTGRVTVLDYVAAHDLGVALNPTMAEGQIVGGVVMGLGAALGEELIQQDGRVVNGAFADYAVPRAADVPPVRAIIVPAHDARGPYGAKSVGEVSVGPPPAVVANAVFDATGVRVTELPLTPDKVLTALAEQGRPDDQDEREVAAAAVVDRRESAGSTPGACTPCCTATAPVGPDGWLRARCSRCGRRPRSTRHVRSCSTTGAVPIGGGTDVALQRRQGLDRAAAPWCRREA